MSSLPDLSHSVSGRGFRRFFRAPLRVEEGLYDGVFGLGLRA